MAVKKMRDKCESEIRHLRKLNHANIVAFKGVCTQSANHCIVMEYCPFGQLYEYLKQCDHMPPGQVLDWSYQIASGMNYLHQHKIIHRDLKSPNVLISHNSVLKISDFGTSRQLSDCSKVMSFAGTVAWMAPEVIRIELCSEKVDIWYVFRIGKNKLFFLISIDFNRSFGVVMWELLTLEIPYRDFEQSSIIYGVGNAKLNLPLPETFPKGYRLLMTMCWKPKPRNRPSFQQILTHINIASREFHDIKPEEFRERQKRWKEEVQQCLSQTRISFNNQLSMSSSSQMAGSPGSISSKYRSMLNDPDAKSPSEQKYEVMLKKTASLYTDMVEVIAGLAHHERQLWDGESSHPKSPHEPRLAKNLLQKVLNDPAYQSALELSRSISGEGKLSDANQVGLSVVLL